MVNTEFAFLMTYEERDSVSDIGSVSERRPILFLPIRSSAKCRSRRLAHRFERQVRAVTDIPYSSCTGLSEPDTNNYQVKSEFLQFIF